MGRTTYDDVRAVAQAVHSQLYKYSISDSLWQVFFIKRLTQ
ncbi:hypothetical protein HMPREF0813_00123 [Streptococcus anginosus F0211]|uniref:Uncharacterized protein n=1 Tax=Streptococcus anginosus F0211 TaxID=706437 RepID=E6IYR1_STRAP|nr:hypothetical protein HMPREF0813_00123 [Streptococcus anginosus F0211]